MGRGDTHQKNRERRRNGNAEQHGYFPRYVALQIKRADGKWFHPGLTSPAACGFVQARGEFLLRVGALQVLVVGAGVVGLAVARAAAVAGHDVIAAEAADAIGTGISSRNSEVIHAGMYYPSGSLRARHCVRGNRLLHAYCQSRGIAHRKCGKLIVATSAAEQDKLEAIHRQGLANGVPGLRLIDGKTARAMEPELDCIAALHSPETGIIDGHSFMLALQGDLESHGGAIAFETPVERIARAGSGWRVAFDGRDAGTLEVDAVVNSAGLRAQTLARQIEGYPAERVPRLVLAKGNYFSYTGRPVFTRLIYPTPVDGGLGVHVTLDLAGVAKGSALAAGAAVLRAAGVDHALIVAGGDVLALGSRGRRPWRVGVRDPLGPGILGYLDLSDGEAAVSSGTYERYLEVDGQRYHHIIDPRTGRPARGAAGSTVVGRDPELANAAATTLLVGGPDAFDDLTRRLDLDCALLVAADGRRLMTPCMRRRLRP